MLSNEGWLNGIGSLSIVIIYFIFGLFLIGKSRISNAKLLFYAGFMNIFEGFLWLWTSTEFLIVLITGSNSNFPYILHFLIAWIWSPLAGLIAFYIATELLIPKKKWYFIPFYIGIIIVLFTILLIDPSNNVEIIYPSIPGKELAIAHVVLGSPASIVILLMILITLIFNGLGTLIKSLQSKGIIRKKFLFLSIGWSSTIIFTLLEGFVFPANLSIFFKIGIIISVWIMYLGLRVETVEPKKIISRKDIKVEESLFLISQKPTLITEEEVTFHREQKICLVCKGKISRYNIYICPSCDALYCGNCARALEALENACWACNSAIDPSKPVKLLKEKEGKIDMKMLKKDKKK